MKESDEMLRIVNMGRVGYQEALDIQKVVQQQRISDMCDDTLLLLDHPPVLTKGIRGVEEHILLSRDELAARGVEVHESTRGGDVTYLGPGQVIGYVIMNIDRRGRDIRHLVGNVEQTVINILEKEFGISAYVGEKKYTGVFVENDKIAAIGIAVNRRVTMHGFAFNVNTDLSHFDWIVPCGLKDRGVTSIEKLTGSKYDAEAMKELVIGEFEQLFDTDTYRITREELMDSLKTDESEKSA